jgi:orotidine-5'-phosphate decarboxylase
MPNGSKKRSVFKTDTMTREELFQQIRLKQSFLCIGLDTDIKKIPGHLLEDEDPVYAFNKAIIDNTHEYAIAYKPNLAFYESLGVKGWSAFEKTIKYLKRFNVFIIADAKRGDIGNTSSLYARAFFELMNVDAVTVAPYMGSDSVSPFLAHDRKWIVLLALTSNKGASDFQLQIQLESGKLLFEDVLSVSKRWGSEDNMMYVVGATQAEMFAAIRRIIPDHFLLVPGVGAQGGDLEKVAEHGMNKQCGLIINSSRAIIYAGSDKDFADMAGKEARKLQVEMASLLKKHDIL